MNAIAILLTVPLVLGAAATQANPGSERGGPHGPPPDAIEACAELSEGAACSFAGRHGDTLQGSCVVDERGSSGLACLPADAPDRKDSARNGDED